MSPPETSVTGGQVLVVDDDSANRTLLRRLLEAEGLTVREADNGVSALDALSEELPDLVLLDLMMPGMSGLQVLERVRAVHAPHQQPVIIATARTESTSVVDALDRGANDYVTKPFDREVLIARVRARLRIDQRRKKADPELLDERYRLEETIGSGGESVVWRGCHVDLERPVAIKVVKLPILASGQAEARARLKREGIAACRIDHPNAVDVLDFGLTDDGRAYLVMELLKGHDLAQEIRVANESQTSMSIARAADVLLPVTRVLAKAHRHGLIHRDVKPGNIFLHHTDDGEQVKLLDFGVARLMGGDRRSSNGVVGTLSYMAPERLLVQPHDGKVDVYALGNVLYEILAGAPPFDTRQHSDEDVAAHHVHVDPPRLDEVAPGVPPSIADLAMAALAKDPLARPSAGEFGIELSMAARLLL
jgi:DNA-binding response OmpR family regulator